MRQVTIDVEARFIDNMSGEAKRAATQTQSTIDKLNKQKVKPTLDADDSRLTRKLQMAEDRARRLGRTKTAMVLHAIDKATNIISRVLNKGREFGGKIWSALLKVRDSDALSSLKQVGRLGRNLAGKTWRATVKVVDYATAPLRGIKNMLFSVQTLIGGIMAGYAAKKAFMEPLGLADAYSGAHIGFSTLLGEDRGQQMMNDLDTFAKATPFKSSEVIGQTQRMLAMGWNAEDIIKDMTVIGDAAAATGKGEEGLNRITLALAQIKSKGKLSTEELNQLAEAGISAKRYLAEGLGYGSGDAGIAKLSKDLEKGAIGSEKALGALIAGMKEYEGMMDKTANETAKGLWSQIEDTFEINIFRRWGQGIQAGAKQGLGSVVSLLDTADGALGNFGDTLYEVGRTLSSWAADKLKDTIKTIQEVTQTDKFMNADLGGKVGILWDEVIGNPLSEWWNSKGKAKFGEIAVDIGKALGQGILEALSAAWDALPWWGKMLAGGYGAAKGVGLINSVVGGASTFIGHLGTTGVMGVGSKGLLGSLANLGYGSILAHGGTGMAVSGGAAAALGASTIAGGAIGIGAGISGAYDTYQGIKNNDKKQTAGGMMKLGGAGLGAAIGTAIAPGVGTAIGAGLGGLIGWIGSKKVDIGGAEKAAKALKEVSSEIKALGEEDMEAKFGSIKLSAAEVKSAVDQLIGPDVIKRATAASEAIDKMGSSLSEFDATNNSLKKELWLTRFKKETKLAKDEVESLKNTTEIFTSSAKTFVKDAQFASSESITAILGNSDKAEKVLKASSAYYDKQSKALSDNTKKLDEELSKALSDGVITVDEEKSLQEIRGSIAKIMAQIQKDKYQANINIIDAKYGDPDISVSSFGSMMDQMEATAQETAEGYWNEFGTGSIGLKKDSEEYKTLLKGTLSEIAGVWQTAGDLGLDKLQSKWDKELGILGEDFATIMEKNTGPQIMDAAKGLSDKTRGSIAKMLEHMAPTTEEIESLAAQYEKFGMKVPEALQSYLDTVEFYDALAKGPEAVEAYFKKEKINIDPQIEMVDPSKTITRGFDPVEKVFQVKANVDTEWTYDEFDDEWISPDGNYSFSTQALVDAGWEYNEFDKTWISPDGEYSFSTAGLVEVGWTYDPFKREWISPDKSYSFSTTANVQVKYKITGTRTLNGNIQGSYSKMYSNLASQGLVGDARGGIEYPAGYNVPRFATGGMVRGGARLIKVAEEGYPEMIIPLSSQRRDRGIKLWEKAGEMLGVQGFARGGRTDNGDEGLRHNQYNANQTVSQSRNVKVNMGGIQVSISVDAKGSANVIDDIKAKSHEIAEIIAGEFADALGAQFENTPLRGGA